MSSKGERIIASLQEGYIVAGCQMVEKETGERVSNQILETIMDRSLKIPFSNAEQVAEALKVQIALQPRANKLARRKIRGVKDAYARFLQWVLRPALAPLLAELYDEIQLLKYNKPKE